MNVSAKAWGFLFCFLLAHLNHLIFGYSNWSLKSADAAKGDSSQYKLCFLPVVQQIADLTTLFLGSNGQNSNRVLEVNSKHLAQGVEGRRILPFACYLMKATPFLSLHQSSEARPLTTAWNGRKGEYKGKAGNFMT